MATFNQIILVGNLGKDVEFKALEGINVLTFNMAVSQKWSDKDGNAQEHTDWFTVDYFTKGVALKEYLVKGTTVLVEGQMVSREYEKDGQKRTAWSVRANKLQLLGGKKEEPKNESSDAPF